MRIVASRAAPVVTTGPMVKVVASRAAPVVTVQAHSRVTVSTAGAAPVGSSGLVAWLLLCRAFLLSAACCRFASPLLRAPLNSCIHWFRSLVSSFNLSVSNTFLARLQTSLKRRRGRPGPLFPEASSSCRKFLGILPARGGTAARMLGILAQIRTSVFGTSGHSTAWIMKNFVV